MNDFFELSNEELVQLRGGDGDIFGDLGDLTTGTADGTFTQGSDTTN